MKEWVLESCRFTGEWKEISLFGYEGSPSGKTLSHFQLPQELQWLITYYVQREATLQAAYGRKTNAIQYRFRNVKTGEIIPGELVE